MKTCFLRVCLESDTTLGRGDGVAGEVDAEVEHDEYGLPYVRGRKLKGLVAEECANLLYAVAKQNNTKISDWYKTADWLFGRPGSTLADDGALHVGEALLPEDLRLAVMEAVEREVDDPLRIEKQEILESLTAIRRQTAMTPDGAPLTGTLRASRVVLRQTVFIAQLDCDFDLKDHPALWLLAASVVSVRRLGKGRNRGLGKVSILLAERADDSEAQARQFTGDCLKSFASALNGKEAA